MGFGILRSWWKEERWVHSQTVWHVPSELCGGVPGSRGVRLARLGHPGGFSKDLTPKLREPRG